MISSIVQALVFRPPKPSTYSADSLFPIMYFTTTKLGVTIPVCVNYPGSTMRRRSFANDPNQNWILFSHGNAEDLGNVTLWTTTVCDLTSLLVVSYDYTGYGLSSSTAAETILNVPTEESIYADAEAALQFAETELGLKREKAILWGRSLGGSATCHLACISNNLNRRVAGVILQSAFTAVSEVVTNYHLTEPPAWDMFRNYDKLKQQSGFDAPCFVIHGTNDWIVNCWHGMELAASIPESYRWPPLFVDCGHNDLEHGCDQFLNEVIEFIQYCLLRLES